MRQTQSDGELIQACLAGNTGAFEGLVEKYQSLVCAITYSGTGRIDTSEELAQEALLQAWKNLGQLRELDKFPAWLCRIARQTVQSWHRKCRRDTIAQAASLNKARSQVSTIQEPAESIIQQEQEAVIQQALARVPEKYREVLVLYYREQKSTQEVGALMGLSKNSVRQRITRARALLKQQVAAMVETSLERSRPSTAFTAVVMTSVASLPFKQSASAAVVGKVGFSGVGTGLTSVVIGLGAKFFVTAAGIAVVTGALLVYSRSLREPAPEAANSSVIASTKAVSTLNKAAAQQNTAPNVMAPERLDTRPIPEAKALAAHPQTSAASVTPVSIANTVQDSKPQGVLCGLITDHHRGGPLAGVRVHLTGTGKYYTVSDANGFYSFATIEKNGVYRILLRSDTHLGLDHTSFAGQGSGRSLLGADGSEFSLTSDEQRVQNYALERGCRLKVQVEDEQSQPIQEAHVVVKSLDLSRRRGLPVSRSTEDDGTITLGAFVPSEIPYRVVVCHGDFALQFADVTLRDPNVITSATIQLEKGQSSSGFVEYADGVPAQGIGVLVRPDWCQTSFTNRLVTVDEEGFFTIQHVTSGRYTIVAHIPTVTRSGKAAPRTVSLNQIEVRLPSKERLTFMLPQQSPSSQVSIAGRIIWESAERPDRMFVSATNLATHESVIGEVAEDRNSFWFDGLDPGDYRLVFAGSGLDLKMLEKVAAPVSDLEVPLAYTFLSSYWLEGLVVDALTQEPIPQFTARVITREGLRAIGYHRNHKWFTCKDGQFKLQTREAGVYQVQVISNGYATSLSSLIDLEHPQSVTIPLSRGGQVKSCVVNGKGDLLSGATVIPLSTARGDSSSDAHKFLSDLGSVQTINGWFHFENLPPGKETFKVTHPDYLASTVSGIMVHEGELTTCEPICLQRGSSVIGQVYDAEANTVPNLVIQAKKAHKHTFGVSFRSPDNHLGTAITDADGWYRIDNLPPDQICYVMHKDPSRVLGVGQRACVPQTDRTIRLDLGGPSVVRGMLKKAGVPLPERRLLVGTPRDYKSHDLYCTGRTDGEGRFRLYGILRGTYGLYYEKDDQRDPWLLADIFHVDNNDIDLGVVPQRSTTIEVQLKFEREGDAQRKWDVELIQGLRYPGQKVGVIEKPQEAVEHYVIRDVIPGAYQVVAILKARRGSVVFRQDVVVTATETPMALSLPIPALSASVSGSFTRDSLQSPRLWSEDGSVYASLWMPDGRYVCEGLPAGRYVIGDVLHTHREEVVFTTFSLAAGEQKTLDLDTRGQSNHLGFLNLQVASANGHVLHDADIWVEQSGKQVTQAEPYRAGYTLVTTPGSYSLVAKSPDHQVYQESVEITPVGLETSRSPFREFRLIVLKPE